MTELLETKCGDVDHLVGGLDEEEITLDVTLLKECRADCVRKKGKK